MARAYSKASKTRNRPTASTPKTQPIPGREAEMELNEGGGFTFKVDAFTSLDRFLILGSEGASYYATEREKTEFNTDRVLAAIAADGVRVVNRIAEISESGRAPKNDPALYALALVLKHGDLAARQAAARAIPRVARIGTHLFHLADYVFGNRPFGRLVRAGFAEWYNGKSPMDLAYQMTKYASRDGWTHADILRLAHVKAATPTHDALFANALGKAKEVHGLDEDVTNYMAAIDELRSSPDEKTAVRLITEFKLPREVIPTELLTSAAVWEALLPHMGMEALIRNLATMTRVGLIRPMSEAQNIVLGKLEDGVAIEKSRIHPIKVLMGLLTYQAGHGLRGSNVWTPVPRVVDALDAVFYKAFGNIVPTGKRILVALDVSGSMTCGSCGGIEGLSPRVASAAMAMVTMRTEKEWEIVGFSSQMVRIPLTAKMTLGEVCRKVDNVPFGGTDCSLPMKWAQRNNVPVDAFTIYTDAVDWYGQTHATQALAQYRKAMQVRSKLVAFQMQANNASIADPTDAGQMEVVGFDAAAPTLSADFIRGDF